MESFAALLTGVLLAMFLWYLAASVRARTRTMAGKLLERIPRPRPSRGQLLAWGSAAILLPVFVLHSFVPGTEQPPCVFATFLSGFTWLSLMLLAHVSSRDLELREHGLILPGSDFVAWHQVRYCKWLSSDREFFISYGEFVIQLRVRNATFETRPTRVEAVTAVLLPRVELRDETGKVLNPHREPLQVCFPRDGAPNPLQFHLRTLFVLLVVASSAFAWLGIHLQATRQQEAVLANQEAALAKFEECQPAVSWFCDSVTDLDFSQCKASPGDADLVYLKDLPDLQFLNLTNARITDAGLVHLASLRQLDYVVLTGTQVTEDGVRRLRESLPNTKIVRESHLPFLNGVTPEPRTKRPSGVR
ncbi:MAG: hypothetical protein NTW96_05770 [Planctomycetia bacterium]|nr:hypothetical protein [Planctomycetia bacterium]